MFEYFIPGDAAEDCVTGCLSDGGFCADLSKSFSGFCFRSAPCREKCENEGYKDGFCSLAATAESCHRPVRSCWCTHGFQ